MGWVKWGGEEIEEDRSEGGMGRKVGEVLPTHF